MPLAKVEHRTDEQRAKQNERMKLYYKTHPEQQKKVVDANIRRYKENPEFRERRMLYLREYRLKKKLEKAFLAEEQNLTNPVTNDTD